jgi:hypothetical protein
VYYVLYVLCTVCTMYCMYYVYYVLCTVCTMYCMYYVLYVLCTVCTMYCMYYVYYVLYVLYTLLFIASCVRRAMHCELLAVWNVLCTIHYTAHAIPIHITLHVMPNHLPMYMYTYTCLLAYFNIPTYSHTCTHIGGGLPRRATRHAANCTRIRHPIKT